MNRDFGDTPPSLPPLLDEFRSALQDEIEVAKRNSSNSAVPLSNGHKVGEQGSACQYAFLIDTVLNTPDGAPGDLIVPGKAPLQVTVVSVEGLRIVISVESDLGKFVPAARLQTNLAILMRKLIERIEKNASYENPAASRMLGYAQVTGIPITLEEPTKLYESQLRALENAMGCNLTVIWGPPGTGKTHTIGTIAEHLYKASRSVLLVSHTNTAVDQAIKHIAKSLEKHLEDGIVVRVGEAADEVLKSKYPAALLSTQVERQSHELVEEHKNLVSQRQSFSDDLTKIQREINIIEWGDSARIDIESIATSIDELGKMLQQEQDMVSDLANLGQQHEILLELHERAVKVLAIRKQLLPKQVELSNLQKKSSALSSEYEQFVKIINGQKSRLEISERMESLKQNRSNYPTLVDQKTIISHLSTKLLNAKKSLENAKSDFAKASVLLGETRGAGMIARVFKGLPSPDEQQKTVSGFSTKINTLEMELSAAQTAYDTATKKMARILELDGELSRYTTVGSYSEELTKKLKAEQRLQQIDLKMREINTFLSDLESQVEQLQLQEDQLSEIFEGDAKEVYIEICSRLQNYRNLQKNLESLKIDINKIRKNIDSDLSCLVTELQEWGILLDVPETPTEILIAVCDAHSGLTGHHNRADLPDLLEKDSSLRTEIQLLCNKISDIDNKLAQVEREVINNASIVGATLTKVYLSDDIQGRKFDTVILDEASMAPIPALWVAALLSESSLVIVGDFKQLPPIVLSDKESTKKWLGSDIFEVSGLKDRWEFKRNPPSYFVPLVEQRRMIPEIAKVANQFYDGMLQNAPTTPESFKELTRFNQWYRTDWPHDHPVVLVDTGSLNAWVTSVFKNGNSSRLNFLSATVAVDLAEQLIRPDSPERLKSAPKRILIVAPYRAHAKLVKIMLSDIPHLKDEVLAGTAHSFQGSEADVVIFDLVVDEPHFRVNLFMPSLNEQLKCLLNVGLTRAKFRLFILGDFDYCKKQGRNAFLGKTLLPFLLKNFPRIDAKKLVPDGLAARAAKAQMTMLGGEIEPNSERIVVTQADFYRLLSSDLSRAKSRFIIYSPFITKDRLSHLMPQLQSATSRGVEVFVITKAHSERSKSELSQIRKIESHLSEVGVVVMHKLRMHEKLVFVDDDITWSGSLNPLSFSNTQEIMERRKSKMVLADYFQTLRLEELIGVHDKPESLCPICGAEMIAVEGADEPYYWRCTKDQCYSRSIGQAYPFNGMLTCNACDCNAPVEFGYWSDYPHWRCTANNRHRQKIFKSHLRLPKMAALIPSRERRKVCRLLHIENFEEYASDSEPTAYTNGEQMSLF